MTIPVTTDTRDPIAARRARMAVLARAERQALEEVVERLGGLPAHTVLKPAETGTLMIEGRAGGSGRRFNLGEATMTRCVVRLDDGSMGFSYALGTDRNKALVAAVIDAMLQREDALSGAMGREVDALGAMQAERRARASQKAAATKVDFFTLVRGHD